ncbi:hypothetical protein V8D89_000359 [Ganoderma adspersum]
MSFIDVVKVPSVVMIMAAEHISLRAPNPVPKGEDQARFGSESKIFAAIAYWFPPLAVSMSFCLHLCEIAVVLAREFPLPLSDRVLSILLKHPANADNLTISPAFVIGSVLLVVGAVWRKKCYDALGRFFTFQLALHKKHKLITTGPYAIVRHPSYTAFFITELGCLMTLMLPGSYVYESGMLKTLWGVVAVMLWGMIHGTLIFRVWKRVAVEDTVLRREFGSQWDAWARKTPYVLIPYLH